MRILILTNNSSGLYSFRKEIVSELLKENEVLISVPENEFRERFEKMGCKYLYTPFNRRGINPFADIKLLNEYKHLIKQIKPDVVFTYTIKPNIYGGLACQQLNVPYFSNITGIGTSIANGGLLSKISLFLYKQGLKKSNSVFFQNTSNLALFREKKVVSENYRLIPGSGVNLQEHRFEEYPKEDGPIRFLFIGRIMKDKGIEELLKAIEKIDNVHLDIVGGYDEDYSLLIDEYQSKGIITYHGRQDNVHSFIKNTHCVVLPSYHEGMSNVMLEAASTGRPVITTNVPGCKETFDEGITGFGCEPRDVDSLCEVMKKFIDLLWEEKKKMGEMGRKKMEREFDRNIVINAYLEEITKLER